jgi:uncharacterized protein
VITLYITSPSANSGKTMLSAGLGKYWLNNGKKVGYLKLVPGGSGDNSGINKDAAFIKKIFNLPDAVETLFTAAEAKGPGFRQAVETLSADKDIVIIEGLELKASVEIIEALSARVLIVHDYALPFSSSAAAYQKLGNRLLGLVLNKVPARKMALDKESLFKDASSLGIPVAGLVPEDRLLMTISVEDLAQALQGKILNNPEKSSDLIENIMMGSSTFDRGAAYYNRKDNKAVILWGERPGYRKPVVANLQSAALQTSVRCLVISANGEPIPAVSQKVQEKQIPVISAPGTLPSLISALENAMGNLKFGQEQKLPRLEVILGGNLNLKLLSTDLGLAV